MVAKVLLVLAVAVEQQPFVLLPALLEQRKQTTVRSLGCFGGFVVPRRRKHPLAVQIVRRDGRHHSRRAQGGPRVR